jgi:hypothetical protein
MLKFNKRKGGKLTENQNGFAPNIKFKCIDFIKY